MRSGFVKSHSQLLAIEAIGLTRATLKQIATVGPLMEFLGHGEHHLHTAFTRHIIPLDEVNISKRIDKAPLPLVEHTTYGCQRAKTLGTWKGAIGHSESYFFSVVVVLRTRLFLASLFCCVRMNSSLASSV